MAPRGASLDTITQIYSHEQGLFQSDRFLSRHPEWEQIPFGDTAGSAQYVAPVSYTHLLPEHRLSMAEKMADALLRPTVVQVSTLELEREGKSYTSDTLEELHRQYPEAELWLLMGTDMFLTLHLWHDPDSILRLAGVCAFGRTEQDGEELFAPQRDFLCERYGAKVTTITLPGLVDISSTRLQKLLGQGEGREYLLLSLIHI